MNRLLVAICCFAGFGAISRAARAEDVASDAFFENRVRPVLAGGCVHCHGPQKQSGGLRLDSRDALVKGGDSGAAIDTAELRQSLLIKAISRLKGVAPMPPAKALSAQEMTDLRSWVIAGAPWPKHAAQIN